jgi:hypothetical protein
MTCVNIRRQRLLLLLLLQKQDDAHLAECNRIFSRINIEAR